MTAYVFHGYMMHFGPVHPVTITPRGHTANAADLVQIATRSHCHLVLPGTPLQLVRQLNFQVGHTGNLTPVLYQLSIRRQLRSEIYCRQGQNTFYINLVNRRTVFLWCSYHLSRQFKSYSRRGISYSLLWLVPCLI